MQDLEGLGPAQDPVVPEALLGLEAHVCVVHAPLVQEDPVRDLARDLEGLDLLGYNSRLTLIIQWTTVCKVRLGSFVFVKIDILSQSVESFRQFIQLLFVQLLFVQLLFVQLYPD